MREIVIPQSEAKLRLLDSAERLFAERGFESVSVRDITQLAKANVAAINYHFGTREGLIGLVVTRYLGPVNDERLTRLDLLERKGPGKAVPVEEILEAYVRPLAGQVRKSELGESLWCKLLGRVFALQGKGYPAAIEDQSRQVSERFSRALGKSLAAVTPEDVVWRSHFVAGALIHLLIHPEMLPHPGTGAAVPPPLEATLSRFIRFAAAGLREGMEQLEPAGKKKGPQAMFDF